MSLYDGAAGAAAVEYLIDQGKLVPDFWLRSEAASRKDDSHDSYEQHNRQVANAVQFAMGKAGVELPDWASPVVDSPDCAWVDPEFMDRFPTTEPYYSPSSLYRAFKKCDGTVDLDTRRGQELKQTYLNLSWRSWRRLIPHFSPRISQNLLEIENEKGNNGNTFSKSYRKDSMMGGVIIRDTALYDFYLEQGKAGLKNIFHGIGQKAILGVGAMMFLSGEHDDLLYTAEQLEEVLNPV